MKVFYQNTITLDLSENTFYMSRCNTQLQKMCNQYSSSSSRSSDSSKKNMYGKVFARIYIKYVNKQDSMVVQIKRSWNIVCTLLFTVSFGNDGWNTSAS